MYYWKAIYENGEFVCQVPDFAQPKQWNSWGHIEQSRVTSFLIYQHIVLQDKRELHRLAFVVHVDGNKRLIYRRRTGMGVNDDKVKYIIHVCGWQETVDGKNQQQLAFLFENDGHIELMQKFSKDNVMFCPVQLSESEQ